MDLAPIVLFVYNRLEHTKKTIEALKRNTLARESNLYIYSDAPKNENAVNTVNILRRYLKNIKGFKCVSIIERETNYGVDKSIVDGVDNIIKKYGKIIVLEDDLVTSEDFLDYMNRGLDFYKKNESIFSITGVNYPIEIPSNYSEDVYLGYRCASWSWATWIDRWEKFNYEISREEYNNFIRNKESVKRFKLGGEDLSEVLTARAKNKIITWDILWCYTHSKYKAFCLYPVLSKVSNIGLDGSGEHCDYESQKFFTKSKVHRVEFSNNLQLDSDIIKNFSEQYNLSFKLKIKRLIKKLIGYYKI